MRPMDSCAILLQNQEFIPSPINLNTASTSNTAVLYTVMSHDNFVMQLMRPSIPLSINSNRQIAGRKNPI